MSVNACVYVVNQDSFHPFVDILYPVDYVRMYRGLSGREGRGLWVGNPVFEFVTKDQSHYTHDTLGNLLYSTPPPTKSPSS